MRSSWFFAAALTLVTSLGCSGSSDEDPAAPAPTPADAAQDTGFDAGQNDVALPDTNVQDTQDTSVSDAGDEPDVSVPDAQDAPVADVTTEPDGSSPYTLMGTLAVDCDVPYVLDLAQVGDTAYMFNHFADLIQQWGITGFVDGQDITAFDEKMYYGGHVPPQAQPNNTLMLFQLSMLNISTPVYSIFVHFNPDTAVTTGSVWDVGDAAGEAHAFLYRHVTTAELCLMSYGMGGQLTFVDAVNPTLVEGGSFHVTGTMDMVVPAEVPNVCDNSAANGQPCCP